MLNIQIEELARVMCGDEIVDSCQDCESTYNAYFTPEECDLKQMAERVINAGYCRVSDVVSEIFAEVDRMIYQLLNDRHYIVGDMCYEVEELKKKYLEVKENDNT